MARPTAFKPEFVKQAAKLCKLGATDADLADFFDVSIRTIANWQAQHPEFLHALKMGKAEADGKVERSLFHRAVGYTFDALKIFNHQGTIINAPYREHVPPDTTAAIFWLKNRKSAQWRDKHDVQHEGELKIVHEAA